MNLTEQLSAKHPMLVVEKEHIAHFGNQMAELCTIESGNAVLSPLLHYGVLEVSGDDATHFLQNQLTNDVAKLAVGGARHAAWCTAKGRMLASFIVLKQQNRFLILLPKELLAPIEKRLRMFVLRSKVQIEAKTKLVVLGLAGPSLDSTLNNLGLTMPEATDKQLTVMTFENTDWIRLDDQRLLVLVAQTELDAIWTKLRKMADPVGSIAWQWLDIQKGLPVITAATSEMFVPQMVGFDALGGVSFNKGCYPGQEIVARTHYLGKVKRHLYRTQATSQLHPGQDIQSVDTPDQTAAQVLSAAPNSKGGWDALVVALESAANSLKVGHEILSCAPVYPKTPSD